MKYDLPKGVSFNEADVSHMSPATETLLCLAMVGRDAEGRLLAKSPPYDLAQKHVRAFLEEVMSS